MSDLPASRQPPFEMWIVAATAAALGFQRTAFARNFRTNTDIRGTAGNALAGIAKAIDPGNCLGDVVMTGYSNDLYGEDDYRYQPACAARGQANRLTCFPGDAIVETQQGPVPMTQLAPGDEVLTVRNDGSTEFEKVLFFLHRDSDVISDDWMTIKHSVGTLTLSSTHLVFRENGTKRESVSAQNVSVGDKLFIAGGVSVVTAVERAEPQRGIFAPVTASGTLAVEGVLASSYASLGLFGPMEGRAHSFFNLLAAPLKYIAQSPSLAEATARAVKALGFTPKKSSFESEDGLQSVIEALEMSVGKIAHGVSMMTMMS